MTIQEIVAKLEIPEGTNYPTVDFSDVDGNIFCIIAVVSKAWRNVDRDVAGKISDVINENCESYDSALAVLTSICKVTFEDGESEEDYD